MKKLKYILIAVLGFQLLPSCDFLDKEADTELTQEMVFNDKTQLEYWQAHVYQGIPDPMTGLLQTTGFEVLGDDITPSERWRQWSWPVIPFILGEWSTTSGWPGDFWRLPRYIRESLIFIRDAKAIPEQDVSQKDIDNMKAECRFMNAYYYYLMVNTYGPIPFKPGYIFPSNSSLSDLMQGRVPYDEIIDWLDNELAEVSNLLPASYTESKKYGRATSVSCLALRARLLLFAASPLVNGNPDYADYVDKTGLHLFNSTYDATKWTRAAKACKDLIDLAEANGYGLYYEYNDDGTIDPFNSCQNLQFTKFSDGNKEILFARPGSDYGSWDRLSTPYGSGGNGGLGVTQTLVDAFFTANGLPITDSNSGYVEKGFSKADEVRNTKWALCKVKGHVTTSGTYNMYCNREPRFYAAVNYNGAYYKNDDRYVNFYYHGKDNIGTHDAPQNGYLLRKKVNPNSNIKNNYFPYRPGIIFRLGEAYLNYAEALNESNPGNSETLKYLNKIRERAGVRQYTTGVTDDNFIHVDLNDQVQMRKLIHMERRVELCCENIRYDDLRRWKEGETVLNGDYYGMNFYGTEKSDDENNPNAFYKRTKYQTRVYKKEYYWFPIFQTEMDKNPNLIQSPYWN